MVYFLRIERKMTASSQLQWSFQLFRDLNCILNKKKAKKQTENTLNIDIHNSSAFKKILDGMSVKDMKQHIINCLAALVRIENKQRESKIYKINNKKKMIRMIPSY